MQNPFSWGYLTAPIYNTPTWGPFSIAFVEHLRCGTVRVLLAYNDLFRQLRKKRLLFQSCPTRGQSILMLIFAIGSLLFRLPLLAGVGLLLSLRTVALSLFPGVYRLWNGYFAYLLLADYPAVRAMQAQRLKQALSGAVRSASSISRGKRHSVATRREATYKSASDNHQVARNGTDRSIEPVLCLSREPCTLCRSRSSSLHRAS